MRILSTNLSTPQQVMHGRTEVTTGIFKKSVAGPIMLGREGVTDDCVADLKVHGGREKACYLYGHQHYRHWGRSYPGLPLNYGLVGENLTVDRFDENEVYVNDIYAVGGAILQVSRPRQPCFKLGLRFNDPAVIGEMIELGYCGAYASVLTKGDVQAGDTLRLTQRREGSPSIAELYRLIFRYDRLRDGHRARELVDGDHVAEGDRKYLLRQLAK